MSVKNEVKTPLREVGTRAAICFAVAFLAIDEIKYDMIFLYLVKYCNYICLVLSK